MLFYCFLRTCIVHLEETPRSVNKNIRTVKVLSFSFLFFNNFVNIDDIFLLFDSIIISEVSYNNQRSISRYFIIIGPCIQFNFYWRHDSLIDSHTANSVISSNIHFCSLSIYACEPLFGLLLCRVFLFLLIADGRFNYSIRDTPLSTMVIISLIHCIIE